MTALGEPQMERHFTEQEIQEIYRAEPELRKLGLIVHEQDADSVEDVSRNTDLIFDWYNHNPGTPLTVQTMCQVAEHLRDKLKWMSKAQIEYIKSYESLSDRQKNEFGAFWNMASTKRTLLQNGDAGFSNCVALIQFARGRDFSIDTFNLALGNLASQGKLHLAPIHQPRTPSHTIESGESFMPKDEVNLSAAERARRDRKRNEQNRPNPELTDESPNSQYWKQRADALTGSTHSDNAILARMAGSTHFETYQMRQRYLNSKQRAGFSRTAV
jgi:hypothetical protein